MLVTNLLPMLAAAAKSVGSAMIIFIMGIGLAWRGVVDQKFTSNLSKVAVIILTPSIRFTSIATAVSLTYLEQTWKLVAYGALVFPLGFVCARLVLPLARATKSFRPWFVICAASPNLIAIPLVLVEAICRNEEETAGQIAHCVEDATARIFTATLTSMFVMWGWFYHYAKWHTRSAEEKDVKFTKVRDTDTAVLKEKDGQLTICGGDLVAEQDISSLDNVPAVIGNCHGSPALDASGIDRDNQTAEEIAKKQEDVRNSCFSGVWRSIVDSFPIIADASAIIVGVLCKSMFYGPEAPMQFLTTSIAVMGKGAPGITNLLTAMSLGFQLMKLEHPLDIFGS